MQYQINQSTPILQDVQKRRSQTISQQKYNRIQNQDSGVQQSFNQEQNKSIQSNSTRPIYITEMQQQSLKKRTLDINLLKVNKYDIIKQYDISDDTSKNDNSEELDDQIDKISDFMKQLTKKVKVLIQQEDSLQKQQLYQTTLDRENIHSNEIQRVKEKLERQQMFNEELQQKMNDLYNLESLAYQSQSQATFINYEKNDDVINMNELCLQNSESIKIDNSLYSQNNNNKTQLAENSKRNSLQSQQKMIIQSLSSLKTPEQFYRSFNQQIKEKNLIEEQQRIIFGLQKQMKKKDNYLKQLESPSISRNSYEQYSQNYNNTNTSNSQFTNNLALSQSEMNKNNNNYNNSVKNSYESNIISKLQQNNSLPANYTDDMQQVIKDLTGEYNNKNNNINQKYNNFLDNMESGSSSNKQNRINDSYQEKLSIYTNNQSQFSKDKKLQEVQEVQIEETLQTEENQNTNNYNQMTTSQQKEQIKDFFQKSSPLLNTSKNSDLSKNDMTDLEQKMQNNQIDKNLNENDNENNEIMFIKEEYEKQIFEQQQQINEQNYQQNLLEQQQISMQQQMNSQEQTIKNLQHQLDMQKESSQKEIEDLREVVTNGEEYIKKAENNIQLYKYNHNVRLSKLIASFEDQKQKLSDEIKQLKQENQKLQQQFQQNGQYISPDGIVYNNSNSKSNGQNSGSKFDDEEEDFQNSNSNSQQKKARKNSEKIDYKARVNALYKNMLTETIKSKKKNLNSSSNKAKEMLQQLQSRKDKEKKNNE